MEKKRLGTTIASKNNNEEVQRTEMAIADDDDFYASGVEIERKIQEIANYYITIHEATGGKAKKEKVIVCS